MVFWLISIAILGIGGLITYKFLGKEVKEISALLIIGIVILALLGILALWVWKG